MNPTLKTAGLAIGALAPGLIVAAGFLSGVYGLADPSMDGSMQPATTGTLMTMSLGTILKLLLLFVGFVLQSFYLSSLNPLIEPSNAIRVTIGR